MSRGFGTAMQVLAGAFGGGASSLGQSRMDQQRFDVADGQFDREQLLRERAQKAREEEVRLRQANDERRLGNDALQMQILSGLTEEQLWRARMLQETNPGMTWEEAARRAKLRVGDMNTGPAPAPIRPPSRVAPPGGRPPRPDLNR